MTQATATLRITGAHDRSTAAGRPAVPGAADRPATASVVRLAPAAAPEPEPAPAPGRELAPSPAERALAAAWRFAWRRIDRTDLRFLAHMLRRYPALATGFFLPTLVLAGLFFVILDVVAVVLGIFALVNGLIFAVTGAKQMARDGFDLSAPAEAETPR